MASDLITIERRELMQLAQMVHQAYHDGKKDIGGTWRTCPMSICKYIQSILGTPTRPGPVQAPVLAGGQLQD